MTQPLPPDPVAAAANLAGALEAMTAELRAVTGQQAEIRRYGHRNRAMIWVTFASITADIILTILLVFGYTNIQNTDARAAVNATAISVQHQNLITSCRAGNVNRAAQVKLWDRVLSQTATNLSLHTPTGRQLLAYIRVTFKPRDCQAVYRTP